MPGMRSQKPSEDKDMILVKIHKTKYRDIVAVCDANLIGKKFEEGDLQLDITERFYKGTELSEDEIIFLLRTAENINVVGEESIAIAVKSGMISKSNIIKIKGIPHAQYATIE